MITKLESAEKTWKELSVGVFELLLKDWILNWNYIYNFNCTVGRKHVFLGA